MPRTGLEEFREVLADFRSVTSWTMKGAVAAPLADYVLHLGAPWPPGGVPVITSLVELLALICLFHFWFGKPYKYLTRGLMVFLVILVVSFFAYLYLFDVYTFANPATSKRYAKGFVVRPDVQALIPGEFQTPEEVLSGSEYREGEVWTAGSLTASRLTLLAVWLTVFASLSGFIGTFIMAQRRRPAKAPVRRRTTKKKSEAPPAPGSPEGRAEPPLPSTPPTPPTPTPPPARPPSSG
jgi:hypothetical protein